MRRYLIAYVWAVAAVLLIVAGPTDRIDGHHVAAFVCLLIEVLWLALSPSTATRPTAPPRRARRDWP